MEKEDRIFYIEDIHIHETGKTVVMEEITEANVASIRKRKYSESLKVNIVEVEVSLDFDEKPFLDSFIALKNKNIYKESDLRKSKKAGNSPLAYQLRNNMMALRKKIAKASVLPSPVEIIINDSRWFVGCLNVGDGDSTVIYSPLGQTYVCDFGNRNQHSFRKVRMMWDRLENILNIEVDRKVSGLFITHADRDHFNGFCDLVDNLSLDDDCFIFFNHAASYSGTAWGNTLLKIDQLINNGQLRSIRMPLPTNKLLLNSIIPGLNLEYLWPHLGLNFSRTGANPITKNDSSLTFVLGDSHGLRFNICGDIEIVGWDNTLLELNNRNLLHHFNDFIYKYSHHGRRTGNPFNIDSWIRPHSLENTASVSIRTPRATLSPLLLPNEKTTQGDGFLFELNGRTIRRHII